MALTEEGRARTPSSDGDEPERLLLDPRDAAFAGQRLRAVAIDPIDFYIGRIGSPPSRQSAAAWRAANELLVGLLDAEAGDEPPGLSSADRRAFLELAESGPFETVRLARPVLLSDQSYSMEFRLQGRDNNIIGEIVVDLRNEGWYSAGIQARQSDTVRMRYAPDAEVPGLVW